MNTILQCCSVAVLFISEFQQRGPAATLEGPSTVNICWAHHTDSAGSSTLTFFLALHCENVAFAAVQTLTTVCPSSSPLIPLSFLCHRADVLTLCWVNWGSFPAFYKCQKSNLSGSGSICCEETSRSMAAVCGSSMIWPQRWIIGSELNSRLSPANCGAVTHCCQLGCSSSVHSRLLQTFYQRVLIDTAGLDILTAGLRNLVAPTACCSFRMSACFPSQQLHWNPLTEQAWANYGP